MSQLACTVCTRSVDYPDDVGNAIVVCPCGVVLKLPHYLAESAGADPETGVCPMASTEVDGAATSQRAELVSLPDDVPAKISVIGLPVRYFRSAGEWVSGGVALLGILWTLGSLYYIAKNDFRLDAFRGLNKFELMLLLVGPVMGPVFAYAGLRGILFPVHILVATHGLIHLRGSTARIIPWDNIVMIQLEWTEGSGSPTSPHTCTLHLKGAETIPLQSIWAGVNFSKVGELAGAIMQARHDYFIQEATERLRSGKEFDVGAATIGPDGLRFRGEFVSWDQIGMVAAEPEVSTDDDAASVRVYLKGGVDAHWRIPSTRITKLSVFLQLLGERVPVTEDDPV